MVTPEPSRIAKQSQFDLEPDQTREHHDLWPSAVKKMHDVIHKIKAAILKYGKILNADVTGQKEYED